MVDKQSGHRIRRETIFFCIRPKAPVAVTRDSVRSPNPQRTILPSSQCRDGVRGQLSLIPADGDKFVSVEAGQAFISTYPEKSIRGLRDRADGILGQPVLLTPGRHGILGNSLRRIECISTT